jgi:streptogramin lyase
VADTLYNAPVMAGNTYYWRVEAKNTGGQTATSPVRRFTADHAPGHMYNVAGTGVDGFGALDQKPLDTQLYNPQDIAFDPAGNLVVVDWNNHRILVVVPDTGLFTLVAGTLDGKPGEPCGIYPAPCDEVDAIGIKINHPTSVTVRPDGQMVLSAWHNYSVMLIDPAVSMSRIAGTGKADYDSLDVVANASPVNLPSASVYDLQGNLVFNDQYNGILRRIDADGVLRRFAGQAPKWNGTRWVPQRGFFGDEGPALNAKFNWDGTTTCGKLAIDAAGNIYVCDTLNHAIRMLDTAGIIHRFAGLNPASAGFSGDGGPATSARLNLPRDVACDTHGNVFIADAGNHVIRMVAPNGTITTVAGTPQTSGTSAADGKLATQSTLNLPFGIDIDPHGNLWIADTGNSRIRVVYR